MLPHELFEYGNPTKFETTKYFSVFLYHPGRYESENFGGMQKISAFSIVFLRRVVNLLLE